MKNLCIIPARSGSKGVPKKNTRLLNGKPLIAYTFEAALAAVSLHQIVVSTDNEEIVSLASTYNVHVPFLRPAEIARDSTPMIEVISHTLDFFADAGENFDTVVLLQPTCPFRIPGFIDTCIKAFFEKDVDCLFSAKRVPHEYNPHWVFEENEHGALQIATGDEAIIPSRQQLPNAYVRDGSVYVFRTSNLANYNSIYGKRIGYLESPEDMHVNIDTPKDWNKAEWMADAFFPNNG